MIETVRRAIRQSFPSLWSLCSEAILSALVQYHCGHNTYFQHHLVLWSPDPSRIHVHIINNFMAHFETFVAAASTFARSEILFVESCLYPDPDLVGVNLR